MENLSLLARFGTAKAQEGGTQLLRTPKLQREITGVGLGAFRGVVGSEEGKLIVPSP